LAGTPCTLVRLAGCPLRCRYCDTPRALSFDSGREATLSSIVEEVRRRGRPLILVTGGEPLAQKGALPLLAALADLDAIVQVETSGALPIEGVDARVRRILDLKAPGSGEEKRNRWQNLDCLHAGDEIKLVIADEEDYRWALEVIERYRLDQSSATLLFAPVWGRLGPALLAEWLLRDRVPARLQIQQHKLIWGGDVEGV